MKHEDEIRSMPEDSRLAVAAEIYWFLRHTWGVIAPLSDNFKTVHDKFLREIAETYDVPQTKIQCYNFRDKHKDSPLTHNLSGERGAKHRLNAGEGYHV